MTDAAFNLEEYLAERQAMIASALDAAAEPKAPAALWEAMRYSLLAPGKRLRPVFCLAACEIAGGDVAAALPTACALEMIHAMTLIHDDLPAMDGAAERRGKPASHVVHGEAMAILAGDALYARAIELVATRGEGIPPERLLQVLRALGSVMTPDGLTGGQVLDLGLASPGSKEPGKLLDAVHGGKTAALFQAATESGAVLAGAAEDVCGKLAHYGWSFGLAFQCADDLLDIAEDAAAAAEPDQLLPISAVRLLGLAGARARLEGLLDEAKECVAGFGKAAAPLITLADRLRAKAMT